MGVQLRVFGDVEVTVDGTPAPLGYAQQRCLLAVLLIEANHIVSVDQLLDRVWRDRRLPRNPRGAVQHSVTLLRSALRAARGVEIVRRSTGYQLTADLEAIDLHRFRRLVDQARAGADDECVAALYEQALAQWRGEPFAGLDNSWLDSRRTTLIQHRDAVMLDLTDTRLRLGQHAALVAELSERVAAHPLDERLAGQLMLALYGSGRVADALEVYQQVRRRLADELGTDPGPPLQRLHQQILAADPALPLPPGLAAPSPGPGPAPGPPPATPPGPEVPQQLPAGPALFIGRSAELASLSAQLDKRFDEPLEGRSGEPREGLPERPLDRPPGGSRTVAVAVIEGSGGIGKTWLALHWAHQHIDRFPDGQLYLNLRGFDSTGEPMPVAAAIRLLLEALRIDPAAIPDDLEAQIGLYRSLVANQRMLIVLDNAADATQVIPLLPGGPECKVLATSRRRLSGLITAHGAQSLELDLLSEAEGRELLARYLGEQRLAAEPDAVHELLERCAGLPLAISVVGTRAASHPDFSLWVLAEELRDHQGRLDALDAGDSLASVRPVFAWSYRALSPPAATAFAALGLTAGTDVSLPAVASLVGSPPARARMLLRELEDAHLLSQHSPGRYRMHDLVCLYAAERATADLPPTGRTEARRRLVDFYLHTAYAAEQRLDPHREAIELSAPAAGCRPCPPADASAALAWLTDEHLNLLAAQQLAAQQGWSAAVWQLAWAMDTFHRRRGYHQAVSAWQAGLAAAERLADPAIEGLAHQRLGNVCAGVGRYAEAERHLRRAISIAKGTGDRPAQAHGHRLLAGVCDARRDHARVLQHATRALRLFRALDMPAWEAWTLELVGRHQARLGRYDEARAHCAAALVLTRRMGDREGEATTLDSLGYIAYGTGRPTRALCYYERALRLLHDLGHLYHQVDTLERIGQAHLALGRDGAARAAWQQALRLCRGQHRAADADRIQRQLHHLRREQAATRT